jgi:hypothetical protein
MEQNIKYLENDNILHGKNRSQKNFGPNKTSKKYLNPKNLEIGKPDNYLFLKK